MAEAQDKPLIFPLHLGIDRHSSADIGFGSIDCTCVVDVAHQRTRAASIVELIRAIAPSAILRFGYVFTNQNLFGFRVTREQNPQVA
jgi:hypothetical protein